MANAKENPSPSRWNPANLVTLSRIVVTPLFLIFIFRDELWAKWTAGLLFAWGAYSDYLDGYLARKYNWKSGFGALLDPLADKILILSVFVSFVQLDLVPAWMAPTLAAQASNPGFLTLHPNRHFLYAVSETAGATNGGVRAFAIDSATGMLTPLNQQACGGRGPCHLAVNPAGTCLLVANYGSGSVASLPIHADGTLGPVATAIQHQGSSVDPQRQQGPHAHSVGFDPAGRRAFCADLGLDKLLVYRLDPTTATLTPDDPPFGVVKPGAGPRHFVFQSNGRRVYVINETQSTITGFDYDEKTGALAEFPTVPTLPATFTGPNTAAEIAIHPNGKFLYGSNRGDNSIAVYAIDGATGRLTLVEHQSTLGKTPRHFGIDPTGKFLLVANQDSDNVVVFRIDPKTGRLTPTGQSVEVSLPTCVTFVPTQ